MGRDHLGWLDSGIVPQIQVPEGSHTVDQHTLQFTFHLWNAMSKLTREHEAPLPVGKHLLSEVVATWNRGKGPIDIYSRVQKMSSHFIVTLDQLEQFG